MPRSAPNLSVLFSSQDDDNITDFIGFLSRLFERKHVNYVTDWLAHIAVPYAYTLVIFIVIIKNILQKWKEEKPKCHALSFSKVVPRKK